MSEKNITRRVTAHGVVYDVRISVKGSGKRYYKGGFTSLEAAVKERDRFKRARDARAMMRQKTLRVPALMDAWMEATGCDKAGSTVSTYQNAIDLYIQPHLNVAVERLSGRRVEALIAELPSLMREGSATYSTARQITTMLKAATRWAARPDVRLIEEDPLRDVPVKLPPKPKARKPFTLDDLRAFVEHSPADARTFWMLLAMTGMRKGEATALRWEDIDFLRGVIYVRRIATPETRGRVVEEGRVKMGQLRDIPMDPDLKAELMRVQGIRKPKLSDWVFPNRTHKGDQIYYSGVDTWWRRSMKAAGINAKAKGYKIHSLRHTFTTMSIDNGAAVGVVSRILGHSNTTTTQNIYQHVSDSQKVEAVSIMGGLLRQA